MFFAKLRSFWSLDTQGDVYGDNNSGEVSVLAGAPHPCHWPWNSSSAVAPSQTCRWTLRRAPVRLLRIPAMNISHSSSLLLFCGFVSTEKRAEMGCVQGHERRLFFFFFFLECVGFYFFYKALAHKQSKPRLSSWRHVGSELLLAFVFFFPQLIWIFSNLPAIGWSEGEVGYITSGKRINIHRVYNFTLKLSFSQQ